MKISPKLLLAFLLLCCDQPGVWARHGVKQPLNFDFEPAYTTATQTGATHVGPDTLYSPENGFGWERGNSIDRAHDRDTPDSPFYFLRKDHPQYNQVRDGVTVVGSNTFTADVPNGSYRVTVYIGDFGPGESREHLFATLNGVAVINDESTAGGQVKVFTVPTQITNGKIILNVEGRGHQKYFPLNGLTLEATATNTAVTVRQLPEKQPAPEDYAQGWKRFVESFREDWETAKSELQQEGNWSGEWPQQRQTLQQGKNYRIVFASGAVRFNDLARRAGGSLDLKDFAATIREIGLDGLVSNDKTVHAVLAKWGINVALGAPGFEGLAPGALPGEAFNQILDRNTGNISVLNQAYTPFSPLARDFFQEQYSAEFLPLSPQAKFMMVDEIRGAYSAGHLLGDYSEAATQAFLKWAKDENITLSSKSLPRPSRTWDFYHFYRFRLGAVPRFTRSFVAGTPLEKIPIYLGNGFLGPEYANHNSLWGPDAISQGYGLASWDYDGNKASAEFLAAMEREHNGKVQNWTALWRSPEQDLADAAVVASAASHEFSIWHQGTFIQSSDRVPWMKTTYLATRLAQALSNVAHDTGIYVYAPDSLVFNDLVGDLPQGEHSRWKLLATELGKGNIDFKVTHTLQVPAGSLVIYAPQRAVLRPDEAQHLTDYVTNGGLLLYASETLPETPDARTHVALRESLNLKNVFHTANLPEAAAVRRLAMEGNVAINPDCNAADIRTFGYSRDGEKYVLYVNTNIQNSARLTLQGNAKDAFSGQEVKKGALEIAKGNYRLLRIN